jgi:hypothetical protein
MLFILSCFFRRLPREGIKSLSVPLITFVLAVLINLLGGIKAWLEDQYEDTMDNFPIIAELSDLTGNVTDGLEIGETYINLFTDPGARLSLEEYTGVLSMKRTIYTDIGPLTCVTITPDDEITFYEGFDESLFLSNDPLCVISVDMLPLVKDGVLRAAVTGKLPDEYIRELKPDVYFHEDFYYIVVILDSGSSYIQEIPAAEAYATFEVIEGETFVIESELTVAGTVDSLERGLIYAPFSTVAALAEKIDSLPLHTELLNITLADNRELLGFKTAAWMSFPRVRPLHDTRPFAMTIYDSAFYETLEPLRQNIILVDVATPFIYLLSIGVGFLTSVLLTRRRRSEFAVMRSAGVHRRHIFIGALTEQTVLSVAGTALGCAVIAAAWSYFSIERPAIFLVCYLLGAVFSAARAAGTDVMKILQERE